MAYYAAIYDLVDDYMVRRGEFRDEHLKLARAPHPEVNFYWLAPSLSLQIRRCSLSAPRTEACRKCSYARTPTSSTGW